MHPRRSEIKDVSYDNCTGAVTTGCRTCKPGFELEKYRPGYFRKCVKKPGIMPVPMNKNKRLLVPVKQGKADWGDFGSDWGSDWDTDFSSSSSSSSSSSESSSSESSSSEEWNWDDDWGSSW